MKEFNKIILNETEPSKDALWLKKSKEGLSAYVYEGGWKPVVRGEDLYNNSGNTITLYFGDGQYIDTKEVVLEKVKEGASLEITEDYDYLYTIILQDNTGTEASSFYAEYSQGTVTGETEDGKVTFSPFLLDDPISEDTITLYRETTSDPELIVTLHITYPIK